MVTYKIPVVWQNWGIMEIEANSLADAERRALFDAPLPNGEYVNASIELDVDSPLYPEEEQ